MSVPELSVSLTDDENGDLNKLGINCLRAFPVYGRLVWGARTLEGADQLDFRMEVHSGAPHGAVPGGNLYRSTKWVVFEPNDEPLWAQIRLNIGAFMHDLFRQGAFQGSTPREAYFVKCDKETTTQNDINLGIVNILVGFAPLKPAEFVIIKIQQMAGSRPRFRGGTHGSIQRQRQPLRSLQELQVPGQVGRPVCRRHQQGQRAQAHHRGRQAPRGRRPEQQPQVARPHRVRRHHAGARRDPRHRVREVGQQGLELSAPAWAPRSRSRTSARTLIIEVYNEAGQLALAYKVYRCWVSEYQALPDLDANANAVAIQHIKLENEGWERDEAVTEPTESSFTVPA